MRISPIRAWLLRSVAVFTGIVSSVVLGLATGLFTRGGVPLGVRLGWLATLAAVSCIECALLRFTVRETGQFLTIRYAGLKSLVKNPFVWSWAIAMATAQVTGQDGTNASAPVEIFSFSASFLSSFVVMSLMCALFGKYGFPWLGHQANRQMPPDLPHHP